MKALICAVALLFLANYCFAQHVYQIRADTVRIYNTCDTAELVLENRTKDTLGFLYNKGQGRTEFRRLHFAQVGATKVAIIGQDTLDLAFLKNGDTAYVPKNRTLTLTGGTGISVSPNTAQDLSANRLWTITNTGVTSVNSLTGAVNVAPVSGSPNYIQNQLTAAQTGNFWVNGEGRVSTLAAPLVFSNSSGSQLNLVGGATASTSARGGEIDLLAGGYATTPGEIVFRTGTALGGTAQPERMRIDATGNVGIGNTDPAFMLDVAGTTRITGNTTFSANGTPAVGKIPRGTDAAGNWTWQTLASGDIPTGSTGYIQNQTATAQAAGFNINGNGTISGGTLLLNNGTSNILSLNATGLNAPTFNTISTGTKLAIWNAISATAAPYAIGMETSHMWFGVGSSANTVGFKWYGGTTQIGRLDGLGSLQLEGQGRFKGWYTANGTGAAAEIGMSGGMASLIGYDRTNSVYTTLQLGGGATSVPNILKIDGTGYLFPNIANYGLLGTDANGKLINNAANFTPAARSITLAAGTGVGITGGTQDLSANRTWTISNTGVTSFNGSAGAVSYNPTLQTVSTNGSITTTTLTVDSLAVGGIYSTAGFAGIKPGTWASSTYMIMGALTAPQHTLISAGTSGDVYIRQANNTTTNQIVVPASGAPYMGTSTSNLLLTSNNHPAGATLNPTLSGANVLATLTTNAAGHVTAATTRVLTAANIGAAPTTGGTGYIQNQAASQQAASFNISGTAAINGGEIILNNSAANVIDFGFNGVDSPTVNTLSAGTKLSLNSAVTASTTGYNIGIENSHMWFGTASNTAGVGFKWYGGTTLIARLDGTGALAIKGTLQTNAIFQTSLRSMKKDIQPFGVSALQVLEKAQVRTFKFKTDSTNRTNIGFIADEVPDQIAAPGRAGVDQTSLVALLVKAVQELSQENKTLQKKNEDQSTQMDAILQRIALLENKLNLLQTKLPSQ